MAKARQKSFSHTWLATRRREPVICLRALFSGDACMHAWKKERKRISKVGEKASHAKRERENNEKKQQKKSERDTRTRRRKARAREKNKTELRTRAMI